MDPPEGISVSEYLSDQDVPEELYQLMCDHLQCPCGNGREDDHDYMIHGLFNLHDDIYTKRDVAEYWGHDYEEFLSFSEKYGETIEVETLKEFKVYLSQYPMLALKQTSSALVAFEKVGAIFLGNRLYEIGKFK
ncbi:hypothetical protein D3C74_324200 [compost metagenome]